MAYNFVGKDISAAMIDNIFVDIINCDDGPAGGDGGDGESPKSVDPDTENCKLFECEKLIGEYVVNVLFLMRKLQRPVVVSSTAQRRVTLYRPSLSAIRQISERPRDSLATILLESTIKVSYRLRN